MRFSNLGNLGNLGTLGNRAAENLQMGVSVDTDGRESLGAQSPVEVVEPVLSGGNVMLILEDHTVVHTAQLDCEEVPDVVIWRDDIYVLVEPGVYGIALVQSLED